MADDGLLLSAFADNLDLACESVGGRTISATDDFFAEVGNLVHADGARSDPERFTDRGKWMDGWESRRKRVPGHDWCVVALGVKGSVHGLDIDTSHFLGNHPPYASLEAACLEGDVTDEEVLAHADWQEVLPQAPLKPGSHNVFSVRNAGPWTHVRLHIYPDGGVARLRVFGLPALEDLVAGEEQDLASLQKGGRALAWSDHFFGQAHYLLLPGDAKNMGGGWETRRRRDHGHDWAIVSLGSSGFLHRLVIDTKHFKGNFPDRCEVEGIYWPDAPLTELIESPDWSSVVKETKLREDHAHIYEELESGGPFTHVRLSIYPCGGVSRLRVYGVPDLATPNEDPLLHSVNEGEEGMVEASLLQCCHSTRWTQAMMQLRPFASRAAFFGEGERQWWRLQESDWQEAFTHHPRIGTDLEALREKFGGTAHLAEGEQAGVRDASEEVLEAFREANQKYEERYGFLFLVCATGKSAEEMLAILEERMEHSTVNELRIAAGEQAKITRLRMEKMEGEG